jgi:spore coat polysaccharide biosynthesis protein SpsF (cytidylyltransferase family)
MKAQPLTTIRNPHLTLVFRTVGTSQKNFHIAQLHHTPDHGNLRWTVDTPEDLTFIRELFAHLKDKPDFTWYDALQVVQQHPELAQINATVRHKTMNEVDERSKVKVKSRSKTDI